jgi:hypothetical protein
MVTKKNPPAEKPPAKKSAASKPRRKAASRSASRDVLTVNNNVVTVSVLGTPYTLQALKDSDKSAVVSIDLGALTPAQLAQLESFLSEAQDKITAFAIAATTGP